MGLLDLFKRSNQPTRLTSTQVDSNWQKIMDLFPTPTNSDVGKTVVLNPTKTGFNYTTLPTGGGGNTLFPNGVDYVTESRYFTAEDAGKRLFVSGVNTIIEMPEINPFTPGDYVGIVNDGTDISFQTEYHGEPIFPLKSGEGSTSECVVLMNTEIEGKEGWLFPISTSFKYDNADNKKKTALKYLYDKSQNVIPLSGTENGSPIIGDIEMEFDADRQIISHNSDYSYSNSILFGTSALQLTTTSNGSTRALSLSDGGIQINDGGIMSHGLIGIQDFTPNITDLDYTQKKYVDNVSGKIINLGTITYEDINSAPTDSYLQFTPNELPLDFYIEKIFINQTELFDGGVETIYVSYPDLFDVDVSNNVYKSIFDGVNEIITTDSNLYRTINIQLSSTNPQNLTTGNIVIKALIKKFPF